MNKTIKKLNITMIIGILAVWVSGSLFHFVYDWTGKNTFAGLFFPTNESTWEHMKLAFLPMNLYGIYTWYALKDRYEASGFTRCKCGNMGNSVSVLHIYGSSWIFKNVA